ncbi:MAG: glycosyltransferase family 2 protein [Siphonobacter sp.]
MKVSVAMCTYNGSKYLPEQLESIRQQSHPIDELIVCDDRSTDSTITLLEQFASTTPFPVQIHINPTNLGSTKNFERALQLCSGEVIFLCDQDDLWRADKVARQLEFLKTHPDQEAVFSNAQIIDDDSKPIGRTIWQEIEFDEVAQQRWNNNHAHEILFGGYVVTGATLAIRKRILASITPFPTVIEELIHDAWIAMILSLQGKIGFVNEELISYRKHSSQQVGFGQKQEKVTLTNRFSRDRQLKLAPLQKNATDLGALHELLKNRQDVPAAKLTQLIDRHKHYTVRATLPASRILRLVPVFREWINHRYTYSSKDWWLPLLGDLFE